MKKTIVDVYCDKCGAKNTPGMMEFNLETDGKWNGVETSYTNNHIDICPSHIKVYMEKKVLIKDEEINYFFKTYCKPN